MTFLHWLMGIYDVWDVLGNIMKLVTNFNLSSFCLVFQAEKEWMTEKRQGAFKFNFYSQVYNYFVQRNVFPEPVK